MTEATTVPVVVATQRIDGTILPGTLFTPASIEQHDDLVALDAVREPTEAELLLHEKMQANKAAAAAKAANKGKTTKAGKEAEAAAAEAAAKEAEAAAAAAEAEAAAAAAAIG